MLFLFNDTATTEIYTLSLHDALPIFDLPRLPHHQLVPARPLGHLGPRSELRGDQRQALRPALPVRGRDRKSTRLNSSHANISYAVFCLKKKKKHPITLSKPTPSPSHT